jgi:hypothetical protein
VTMAMPGRPPPPGAPRRSLPLRLHHQRAQVVDLR